MNDQETLYVLLTPQQILDDLSYRRGYMVWLDYEQDQLGQPSGIVGEGELIAVFRDIVEAQSWCESHPYPYYHYWWTPVAIGSPDALAWLTAKTAGIATDTDWWIARAKRYTGETADSIDWRSDGF